MLQFNDLSLRRGPKLLFQNAGLQIHPGQKAGITGANGTGKSSLFALILGELQADHGDLLIPRDWVIAHVAQETPSDTRPAIDYVLDGDAELRRVESRINMAEANDNGEQLALLHGQLEAIGGYQAASRAGKLMHGLGFKAGQEQQPVDQFSGGWRMRLNLARALMCRSDLLLLDEPTNHLDLDAVIWLENWLQRYPGTLLLISHDRDFLDEVTTQIVHIEQSKLSLYTGNYSAFERIRAEHLANQQAQYEKQQKEVAHIRSYVDRFRAKATKAKQAQSRLKALERMELIAPAHVDSPFHFSFPPPEKAPNPLLRLNEIAAGYADTPIISHISMNLSPGDRIGLLGPNGAGKSTFIKLLADKLKPLAGTMESAKDLKIGYFAQHQLEQLHPEHSPLEHLLQLDNKVSEQEARNYLGGFGFLGDQALMVTGPFSGGEKSRLALALLIYRRPNLLLLDEPTNHLDIEMRQALSIALQDYTGAMIIVSHDRHMLRVTTDSLLLVHDGKVDEFPGSLDDYPRWLADANKQQEASGTASDAQDSNLSRKDQKREQAARRKALQPLLNREKKAESLLDKLHQRQTELEQALADPSLYNEESKALLKDLLLKKAALDAECESQEAIWMEATEALEAVEAESR
jgi:ATP-binding cassette subfamily F protein 3